MDINLDPADYLDGPYDAEVMVRPELFKDSHLMDLMSPDPEHLKNSLVETQRVIDITRDLKRFFPKTERPKTVANVGGAWTPPFPPAHR